MEFELIFFSRLRRGDFRYTTILVKPFSYYKIRASGEAILDTQRYFSKHTAKVSQRYYKGITKVLQRYYTGITKVLRQGVETR